MVKVLLLLFLFSMFLVALPNDLVPQWPVDQKLSPPAPVPARRRHPLCSNLFALANYACAIMPYRALDSPPPPSELEYDRSGRRRGHMQQRHNHTYQETPEQSYCCQWLKQVDTECVCDILVNLPIFLSRPVHIYSVIVDETCTVTYSCGGRVIP